MNDDLSTTLERFEQNFTWRTIRLDELEQRLSRLEEQKK